MSHLRWKLAGMLVCLSGAAAMAAGELMPAGSDKVVWLLRNNDDGKTYDLVARPAGAKWKWIEHGLPGQVAAIEALGTQLHLLLDSSAYVVVNLDGCKVSAGVNPRHPRWPAKTVPVATCSAEAFGESGSRTMIALLPRHEPTTTATTPASRPRAATGRFGRRLGVFGLHEGRWAYLDDVPAPPGRFDGRVLAAVVDGKLYVLTAGAGGNLLAVRSKAGSWGRLQPSKHLAGQVVAMRNVNGRLVVLLTAKAGQPYGTRGIRFVALDEFDKPQPAQPITLRGKDHTWPADELPQVVAFTDGLAFLWRADKKLKFAPCDAAGRLKPIEDVDILDAPPEAGRGEEILNYFVFGVLIAASIALFLPRMRPSPEPFALPIQLRPARLGKRILAGLIDLLPFFLVGGALVPMPVPLGAEGFVDWRERLIQSDRFAYLTISVLLAHTAYCMVMEARSGATIGKMILKLRVVGNEGRPAEHREILVRNLLRIIELMVTLPLALILFTRFRQRLGDLISRTVVVEINPEAPEPADDQPANVPPVSPPRR